MFLKNLSSYKRTLAFRLTLWHAGIFALSFVGVFLACYLWLWSAIHQVMDRNLLSDLNEFRLIYASQGISTLEQSFNWKAESEGTGQEYFRLLTSEGTVLSSSNMEPWNGLSVDREALQRAVGKQQTIFQNVEIPRRHHRARVLYAAIDPGLVLEAGMAPSQKDIFLDLFEQVFGIAIVFFLFSASAAGWFLARRSLAGVEAVTSIARKIAGGTFDQRVLLPHKNRGEEIERLARTFNDMLDRIQTLMKSMRETNDNIAHDLRSPLTRMRGMAEMVLTGRPSAGEYETLATKTIEECDHLLEMINTMLEISEAEAGASKLGREELNLARLAREAVDLFLPVAEDKKIEVVTRIPESCYLRGDKQRLQRMLANLLDNALKYTPDQGKIMISVAESDNQVSITIQDTGIGIAEQALPHIFDRFFRCDTSRSQPGIGLGLSLSLAIARAHGGNIQVVSRLGQGSTFTIILPAFYLNK